jgi:hypothetical protein
MAWVVTSVNKKVTLVSPGANSMLKDAELQFTWKPEGLDDPEYVFCIASAASINPSTMIYQESVGEATEVIPAGFIPERGKTYYWGVLATCSSGDNVWSNSRAFSMQEDQLPGQDETTLNVKIYPNPGQNKDIHITIGSGQAGTVSVSLFEIHGNLVWRTETDYKGNGPETLSLPDLGLRPGVYLVEVHSATGVTTKKVIISNPY